MVRKNSKDDVSSDESDNASGQTDTESEYVVERVVAKRVTKGKVSVMFISKSKWILMFLSHC